MDPATDIITHDPLCGCPITRAMYAQHTTLLQRQADTIRARVAPFVALVQALDLEIARRQAVAVIAPPLEMPR